MAKLEIIRQQLVQLCSALRTILCFSLRAAYWFFKNFAELPTTYRLAKQIWTMLKQWYPEQNGA